MKPKTRHDHLLKKHQRLDYLCRHPEDRLFISDWYCSHPFVQKYLPTTYLSKIPDKDLLYYCFQNDGDELHREISHFHQLNDHLTYEKEEIFVGAGMTPLLSAQMIMMKSMGVKKILYTRPLYYMFYYVAKVYEMELIPICDIPLNQLAIKLRLPRRKSWLIICDPLWYMGKSLIQSYVEQIRKWQEATESYILVDGAFQYMKWNPADRWEPTATLNKELTFRSICPTKALALHGIRFSYTLLPKSHQENMRYAYSNTLGSSCIYSHLAAKRIMQVLNSKTSNSELLTYIQQRYHFFMDHGLFEDPIHAESTYFIFVKMLKKLPEYIVMDQDFFDTTNYPGFVRFNLLLPHKIPGLQNDGLC